MRRLLTLTLIATLAGCSSDSSTGPDRPITAVAVSPSATSIVVGQSIILTASVTGGFSKPVVVWASSNLNVATVTDSGVVATRAIGTVTVTATAGGIIGSATITVTAVPPPPSPTVTLTPASSALIVGQTSQLVATVTNATSSTVVWTTSNQSAATVDQTGRVTATGAGSATISATLSGVTGTASLTVTNGAVDHVTVCAGANVAACSNAVTLGAIGTSATVRAAAFNAPGADISSVCTFTWTPSTVGVVSISFFGDNTKRDALITRTGTGVVSIIVSCGAVPGVFTVN